MKYRNLSISIQSRKPLVRASLKRKSLAEKLDRLWQSLAHFAEITQDPKVTWRRDYQGRSYFEIYDFSTEKHHRFDAEQDARIWLDRVRYQQTETQEELLATTLRSLNNLGRR